MLYAIIYILNGNWYAYTSKIAGFKLYDLYCGLAPEIRAADADKSCLTSHRLSM